MTLGLLLGPLGPGFPMSKIRKWDKKGSKGTSSPAYGIWPAGGPSLPTFVRTEGGSAPLEDLSGSPPLLGIVPGVRPSLSLGESGENVGAKGSEGLWHARGHTDAFTCVFMISPASASRRTEGALKY